MVAERQPGPHRGEPVFNMPLVVVAMIALCAVIHLLRTAVFTPEQDAQIFIRAAFVPARYSGRYLVDLYAFTTPITYSLLHGSWLHLGVNMVWLAAFGSPLAARLGAVRFLAFWVVTSIAAVALHYVLHANDMAPLVGASGAVSGMMGAAARFGFQIDRSGPQPAFRGRPLPVAAVVRSRAVMTFLAVWMIVNVATGLIGFGPGVSDQIAWEAHIGGFFAGFLLIGWFDRRAGPSRPASRT